MQTTEINLLIQASSKIKQLQHQNELQAARLGVFDDIMLLLRSTPGYGGSMVMEESLTHKIDSHIKVQPPAPQ